MPSRSNIPGWLLALVVCSPGFALDRDRRIDQLYHTSWTLKDGAPAEIFAIAQTTDGYLWLGTTTGLVRFDGVRFEDYTPQKGQDLPEKNVSSLLATPDGALWIGFGAGGVSLLKQGIVTSYGAQDGLPSGSVRAIVRDRQGRMWAAALGGLARLESSHWREVGPDWNFSGGATTAFLDRKGTLWVGTPDEVASLPEGAKRFQKSADHFKYVTRICEAADGTVWIAELGRSVRPMPLSGSDASRSYPEIKAASIAILFDDQGSLWVPSIGAGLRRIHYPERPVQKESGELDIFTQKQGLTSDYIESIFEDREGNIWLGTNAGLDRFRQSTAVSVPLPPSISYLSLMAGEHGIIWAANNDYSLLQIQNGHVVGKLSNHFAARGPLQADRLYCDPQGAVWMAGIHDLMRFGTGRQERINYPTQQGSTPSDPTGNPITMAGDKSGRLWVSFRDNGVFQLEDRRWKSLESLGGPKGVAISAFTDSDGKVWLGFIDRTLVRIDQEKIEIFSSKDGIAIGKIRAIHARSAKVWIGGDAGVALFDGIHFHTMIPSDRMAFADVFGIVETAHDGLWFSERNGVIHVPAAEMLEFGKNPGHRVDYQAFGLLDGIPARLQKSTAVPSVVEGSDGLLWFATTHGIVWINPKRVSQNTVAPPVSIQSIVADTKSYLPYATLTLPARTANLKIAYTGLSFAIPERVRFRYKMEGLENVWQEAGTRREAFYTNPGPGSYRFHVLASNDAGVWNATGAVLDIVVQAAFYQTLWFRSLCALAAVGLVWLVYHFRLKQATVQLQVRLGERLEERERIARELHDTLLQGFYGLVLRFEAAMKQISGNEPARQMMDKALERADQVLLEGRLRVLDLRSETTAANDLAESLRSCGEEFSHDGAVSFRVSVVGTPRPLDPIAYDEAYRIGRESLVNAFQHSLGSRIEAEITYARDSLRLTIRDDGAGIEPKILSDGRAGHWGLSGLRERAENIGGHLRIVSQRGAGTEVDLVVPAGVAYPKNSQKLSRPWIKRVTRRGLSLK